MMMKYRNNLSIGFSSGRGIGILCDCALSTNICLNIHHGSALAFQIIENFGQMPDRELHNSAASNAEGTRGWRAATWPLLEEEGDLGKIVDEREEMSNEHRSRGFPRADVALLIMNRATRLVQ